MTYDDKDVREPSEQSTAKRAKKERTDYPRITEREEYAAEVAPIPIRSRTGVDEVNRTQRQILERPEVREADADADADEATAGRTVGYVSVGLGIASLFLWSIILGPVAAIMGFYAYSQGSKTSGAWGIGLGLLATLSYFVVMPFTR